MLESITSWPYPKTDLYNWIGVLDKLDALLEAFVTKLEYSTKFNPAKISNPSKALVLAILKFSRLLIEHGSNRSVYSSYDNLNLLLQCSDTDIVEQTLKLLLKLAQRISLNRSMKSEFVGAISKSKVKILASNWDTKKDFGLDLVDLGSPEKNFADEVSAFKFQFYRSSVHAKNHGSTEASSSSAPPATPVKGSTEEGLVNIKMANLMEIGKTPRDIFNELMLKFNVPHENHFNLFHRIRISLALHSASSRRQLLSIKLLSIAILCK